MNVENFDAIAYPNHLIEFGVAYATISSSSYKSDKLGGVPSDFVEWFVGFSEGSPPITCLHVIIPKRDRGWDG